MTDPSPPLFARTSYQQRTIRETVVTGKPIVFSISRKDYGLETILYVSVFNLYLFRINDHVSKEKRRPRAPLQDVLQPLHLGWRFANMPE